MRRRRTGLCGGPAEVVFRLGAAGMSIERVRAASGASRSQVYRYFPANAISLAIYRLVPEINQMEFVRGRPSLPPRLRHDRHSVGHSLTPRRCRPRCPRPPPSGSDGLAEPDECASASHGDLPAHDSAEHMGRAADTLRPRRSLSLKARSSARSCRRSRDIASSTGPTSVRTAFGELPLRWFRVHAAARSPFSYRRCSDISSSKAVCSTVLSSRRWSGRW
jgi:AcrR family transcriptional regulator